jgi:hypothetical protein
VAHEIELLERIAAAPEPAGVRLKNAVEAFARRALDGRNLAYAFIAEPIGAQVESEGCARGANSAPCSSA